MSGPNVNPMPNAANDAEQMEGDILSQKETLELVRAYYRYFTPRFTRASRRVVAVSEATRQDARR